VAEVNGERVLVVDDEPQILRALAINLRARGYDVDLAPSGEDALRMAADHHPDVVILDLGLPGISGIDVIRGLRGWSSVPIIILSAREAEADKIAALDAGADDYVTKPFRLAELMARIRAALRRAPAATVTSVQDVRIDHAARRVWRGDVELDLSAKEFDLLALLAGAAGQAVTRDRIMREVWDEHWYGPTKTLDMHISWLRKKLGDDPSAPRLITTLRGVGFRFETG